MSINGYYFLLNYEYYISGDNPHEHKDTKTELSIESNDINRTESSIL